MPSKHQIYKNGLRAKYKAAGLCVTCGGKREDSRGTRVECEACAAKRKERQHREYHAGFKKTGSSRQIKYKELHTARIKNNLCYRCGKVSPVKSLGMCQACCDIKVAYMAKVKDDVYHAYGGYKCNCCGETIKQFLTIDHINNDGAAHRLLISANSKNARKAGGKNTYLWLKRHKYPAGFQILCMNCNIGKHLNGGVCPHKSNLLSSRAIAGSQDLEEL